MQILTVVNDMIGLLGESRLASLEEHHEFKGSALALLDEDNRSCQAKGWWYNMEVITLEPMLNGRIALSGDTINLRTYDNKVVQRGRYLYDLENGTDIFTRNVDVTLIRLIPFEDLPESAAAYIAAKATTRFQLLYDGDSMKQAKCERLQSDTFAAVNAEAIRNKRVNMILSNPRLMRLKFITNQARRFIRI